MNKLLKTNVLAIISLAYLIIPVAIYFATWTKIYVFTAFVMVLFVYIIFSYKNRNKFYENNKETIQTKLFSKKIDYIILIVTLAIIALWLYLCGIGGLTGQTSDGIKHNTILKDLINNEGPVNYNVDGTIRPMIYYIGYYLPAALVGKLGGYGATNITLFIGTFTAVVIGLLGIYKICGKVSIVPICVLVAFSGVDILGYIINNGGPTALSTHLEGWAQALQFSSITSMLNGVPQMFCCAIIVVPMLLFCTLNKHISQHLYPILSSSLLGAPFIIVGIIPFFIYYFISVIIYAKKGNIVKQTLKKLFCGYSILLSLVMLFVICMFYAYSTGTKEFTGFIWNFVDIQNFGPKLMLFAVLEIAIPVLIAFTQIRKLPMFSIIYVCLGTLIVCMFVHMGLGNDFAMRVSIPALLIIAIYTMMALLKIYETSKLTRNYLPLAGAIILLIVMAYTPLNEVALKFISTPSSIEKYSTESIVEYLYPYQYMAENNDNAYQDYIARDVDTTDLIEHHEKESTDELLNQLKDQILTINNK